MRAKQFLWILIGLLSGGVYAQNQFFYTPNAGQSGLHNTLVGYAGVGIVTGTDNNTAVGSSALYLSTGSNNCAFGTLAMGYPASAASGDNNCAFGYRALSEHVSGNGNVAIGYDALRRNQTGNQNVAIGESALREVISGSGNIAIGLQAGQSSTNMGDNNIFIGISSGTASTGAENIIIGNQAGANSTGTGNLAIGYNSGADCTGNYNTFIGRAPLLPNSASTSQSIGSDVSNSVIIADGANHQKIVIDGTLDGGVPRCNIGLGLANYVRPQNKLDLNTAGAVSGTLGFRFRGLGSAITGTSTTANSNNLVMTVNSNGDVIMVPDGGSGSGGGITSITTSGNSINLTPSGTPVNSYAITANNLYNYSGNLSSDRTVNLAGHKLFFDTTATGTPSAPGQIYIGTQVSTPVNTGNYRLYVEGGILTEKIKVATRFPNGANNWSDYVFDDNYNLPSLKEVEAYIEKENHLPNIPSADEIACDGLDLADMQAKQMAKIEELTLYVIEQNKMLLELRDKLEARDAVINELQAQLGYKK